MYSVVFVLALFLSGTLAADYCSNPKLCEKKGPHVTCDPDFNWQKTCPSTPTGVVFGDHEQNVVLKAHNKYRNKIAGGHVKHYKGAAGMPELKWDKQLEEVANANAQACVMKHDKCRATDKYSNPGQNIGILKKHGNSADTDKTMKHLIHSWWKQHKRANKDLIESYHPTKGKKHADNFARMVNDQAMHVGCSLIHFHKGDEYSSYFVCNYDQDVELGKPVYKEGKHCGKCPKDAPKCSAKNKHLCQ